MSGEIIATVTVEVTLTGLLSFALATGLLFARFSRPVAHIVFSKIEVIVYDTNNSN